MKRLIFLFFLLPLLIGAQSVPTPAQLRWHEQEFYLFLHFGPNTFTGKEWGEGNEPEDIFNPDSLDARQWCRIARQAGARGLILTAKHHDGFCLWPSRYSTHTVRESKWKEGKGDVLKELSQACAEAGLFLGFYISPWDRHHPDYGTPRYNDVFVGMLEELMTNYGPVTELWWDGANGEGPNGKRQEYDWPRFVSTVRRLSPQTLIFSDVGPDIRWVGNEAGEAGETNWNYLTTEGFTPGAGGPPLDTLRQGQKNGRRWIPAECDVSIRPGWFYHPEEDTKVKTPQQLLDLYLKSVGRGANLLLNVPPDRRGRISAPDSAALAGFASLRKRTFGTDLARQAKGFAIPHTGDEYPLSVFTDGDPGTFVRLTIPEAPSFRLRWDKRSRVNCIVLHEKLDAGQQVARFRLVLEGETGQLSRVITGTTIGRKRIITFPATDIQRLTLYIQEQLGPVTLGDIQVYHIPD